MAWLYVVFALAMLVYVVWITIHKLQFQGPGPQTTAIAADKAVFKFNRFRVQLVSSLNQDGENIRYTFVVYGTAEQKSRYGDTHISEVVLRKYRVIRPTLTNLFLAQLAPIPGFRRILESTWLQSEGPQQFIRYRFGKPENVYFEVVDFVKMLHDKETELQETVDIVVDIDGSTKKQEPIVTPPPTQEQPNV